MAFWDSLGETFTDFVGQAGDAAGKYAGGVADAKVENAKKAESAAPEENRKPVETQVQQPTGAPVHQPTPAPAMNEKYLLYGMAGALVIGLFIVALKK